MSLKELSPEELAAQKFIHRIAWTFTVALHGILILLMMLINLGSYEMPEWVEMEFVAVKNKPAPAARPRAAAPAPVLQETQEAVKAPPKKRVQLPKRRMLEEEQPVLERPKSKISVEQETRDVALKQEYSGERRSVEPLRSKAGTDGKSTASASDFDSGDKEQLADNQDFGKGVAVPFKIEGEAADRIVLFKEIPEYPPGLRREAVVRIRFRLLPSGVVANMVPVLKGDATLEKVAMDAFRKWRFNSLAPESNQRAQQGIITFRFVLQ